MKNYHVRANRNFKDSVEDVFRIEGKDFYCTKERYEYLVSCNNAVELIDIVVEEDKEEKENLEEKVVEKHKKKKSK